MTNRSDPTFSGADNSDDLNPSTNSQTSPSAPNFETPKLPQLVYFHPEIPGNTGAAIRLCAVTGSRLHLIEPLGFVFSETKLRRAGLDYHDLTEVKIHHDFDAFLEYISTSSPARILAFRSQASRRYCDFTFRDTDYLLFGPESSGLPSEIYTRSEIFEQLTLPMIPHRRSMNLTNTASVALFESWRQLGFPV
jgi:tRNA (cytidine/uridine-2'-O-)-methyltransferase